MRTLAAAAILAAISGTASADVITSWANFGQTGDQAASPVGTQAANVTGAAMTRGAGLSPNAGSNSLNSAGWDTLAANDYISFGFSVAAGYEVDLSTLWMGTRSSNTGPGFLSVYSSLDGFASPVFSFSQVGTAYTNSIADVSALSDLTGSVEFRIYADNGVSANGGAISGTGTFRVGDHSDGANFSEFRFEGTVSQVPAPASAALMGLGGLVAARRRR